MVRVARGTVATSTQVKAANCGVVAVGVGTGPDGMEPGRGAAQAAVRYGIDLAATASRQRFTGAVGAAAVIDLPVLHAADAPWRALAQTIVLVGVGDASPSAYRAAGARLARVAQGRGPVTATLGAESPAHTRALVEGYLLGAYRPRRRGLRAADADRSSRDASDRSSPDRASLADADRASSNDSNDSDRADRASRADRADRAGRDHRDDRAGRGDRAGRADHDDRAGRTGAGLAGSGADARPGGESPGAARPGSGGPSAPGSGGPGSDGSDRDGGGGLAGSDSPSPNGPARSGLDGPDQQAPARTQTPPVAGLGRWGRGVGTASSAGVAAGAALTPGSGSMRRSAAQAFRATARIVPRQTDRKAPPPGPAPDLRPADEVGDLTLLGSYDRAAVQIGWVTAQAAILARDLGNEPASVKNPAWLEAVARAEAKTRNSVAVTALGPEELAKAGLNGILAVGAGAWLGPAANPALSPRLILATHTPANLKDPGHLVIVGKGITFDTGGLDVKTAAGMVTMKTDMAGAAVALATVLAASDIGVEIKVSAVLPAAQNALGAASYRPGDVLSLGGGRATAEIGDTDAEGRVVLADALAYAASELDPTWVVDIATLTGAQKIALGHRIGALFSTDDELAGLLGEAGEAAGEQWWRMPLADLYEEAIASPNADVATVARRGFGGGAITAALFLRRFAGGAPWAHLDVAGPARAATGGDLTRSGATAFGTGTLIRLAQRLT
jgi:leucyl aminopeptidase